MPLQVVPQHLDEGPQLLDQCVVARQHHAVRRQAHSIFVGEGEHHVGALLKVQR